MQFPLMVLRFARAAASAWLVLTMLISVCVVAQRPHRRETLKKFGFVQCKAHHSLADIYSYVSKGVLSSGDNFVLPKQYEDVPVLAEIGESMTATFQSVPLHLRIDGAVSFRKYLQFVLKVDTISESATSSRPTSSVPNAFHNLLNAQRKKVWPKFKNVGIFSFVVH